MQATSDTCDKAEPISSDKLEMDSLNDHRGPPLKKMRKGTKSCSECRRRKIRCTYDDKRPDICNECRLRGSKCIDQEHGSDDPNAPSSSASAERYSLRERVAYLETVVHDLAKKLDQTNSLISRSGHIATGNITPTSPEPDRLGPASEKIENAPVMQLFDNYLVSRRDDPSSNDQFTGAKDMSPKARAVRRELLLLYPPDKDVQTIMEQCSHLWCIWEEDRPGLEKIFDARRHGEMNQIAPADIAKALVCLALSVIQSRPEFNWQLLQMPIDPQQFASRCIEAVDRLVVRDDDFSATLPGIECHLLLSKFHMNEGRLRKSWLINRRAIELAHLAGMHLSTRKPQPSDALFERRLKIWCALATSDRNMSFMVGLPYAVADKFFLPQVERRLKSSDSFTEQYMLRIGVIIGHMIDRNQDPEMSVEATLKLDEELMEAYSAMPDSFLGLEPGPDENQEHYYERIPLQFMPKSLRALLHLPFMLKDPYNPKFNYCHRTAIQAAREALHLYKIIRSSIRSYLCKTLDFVAFTMTMLLILHLHGSPKDLPDYSKEQDEQDWELVGTIVANLRKAACESGGSVAAESAHILGEIYHNRCEKEDWDVEASCKITVPYFGTITVGAGSKFTASKNKDRAGALKTSASASSTIPSKRTASQIYTPPLSDTATVYSATPTDHSPNSGSGTAAQFSNSIPSGETISGCFGGMEATAFSGLFGDNDQYIWPNPNVDLGLDQGWDLNWFESNMLPP